MKKIARVVVLVSFIGFGLTHVAQAQSIDAPGEIGGLRIAELSRDDLPPLFAKLTAPSGTAGWGTLRVPATRGAMLPALYSSLIVLQAYDGYSTSQGLKNGAVESNRIMSALVRRPAALWAVKGGSAFVSIYAAERLWRKHKRGEAIALMIASNTLMAGLAANNAAIIRNLK